MYKGLAEPPEANCRVSAVVSVLGAIVLAPVIVSAPAMWTTAESLALADRPGTVGKSAVPDKSPASLRMPLLVVVASGTLEATAAGFKEPSLLWAWLRKSLRMS